MSTMENHSVSSDFFGMTKPRIVLMSVLTAAAGGVIGGGSASVFVWLAMMVGTGLIVASASVLNMYLERDTDGLMPRTKTRPLPQKRIDANHALLFGIVLAFAAIPLLSFAVSPLAGLLGAVAFVLYVNVYTPMKRWSSWSTVVGAIPGAMPVLMGAAMNGDINLGAISVFVLLCVWQLPHFYAIVLFRYKEYHRAGLATLVDAIGVSNVRWTITACAIAQLAASLWVFSSGASGMYYAIIAGLAGLGYFAYALWGAVTNQGPRWAKQVFAISIIYLPIVMMGLVANA